MSSSNGRPKLLFNCQKHGHKIDPDWPTEAVVIGTPRGEHFAYAVGRCSICGCFYSLKEKAPAPSGLIDTKGKVIA